MKYKIRALLLCGLVVISLAVVTGAYAQRGTDSDGDGVLDNDDLCPAEPGPAENDGCPVLEEAGPPCGPDSDSDGISDRIDLCPFQSGPPDTGGCPLAESSVQPFTPRRISADGLCSVVATSAKGVNVREHFSTQAPVVGVLEPDQVYPITAAYYNSDETWYLLADPAGFVLSDVVVLGGQCSSVMEVCVYAESGMKSESDSESAAPSYPSPMLTVGNDDESDQGCEAEQNLPQLGGPQPGLSDDTMNWSPLCYLGLTGYISIGVSVELNINQTLMYENPFDETPMLDGWTVPTASYGRVLDGPACRNGVIMWRVTLVYQHEYDEHEYYGYVYEDINNSYVGWVFQYSLKLIPD